MNDMVPRGSAEDGREFVFANCCWPNSSIDAYLWGGILMFAGSIWLLDVLDVLPDLLIEVLWPLIPMAIGLAFVIWAAYPRRGRQP